MNARERYLATAAFKQADRTFLLPPWVWNETQERWRNEGLPKDARLHSLFQTDIEDGFPLAMQGWAGPHLHPPLERKVLSETDGYVVIRNEEGNVTRKFKNDSLQSMPEWIEYPMKDRDDREKIIKSRIDGKIPGRSPQGAELDKVTGNAWVAGVTSKSVTVNGSSTGSGDAKPWTSYDKDKETITLKGLTGTVAVTAQY